MRRKLYIPYGLTRLSVKRRFESDRLVMCPKIVERLVRILTRKPKADIRRTGYKCLQEEARGQNTPNRSFGRWKNSIHIYAAPGLCCAPVSIGDCALGVTGLSRAVPPSFYSEA